MQRCDFHPDTSSRKMAIATLSSETWSYTKFQNLTHKTIQHHREITCAFRGYFGTIGIGHHHEAGTQGWIFKALSNIQRIWVLFYKYLGLKDGQKWEKYEENHLIKKYLENFDDIYKHMRDNELVSSTLTV